MKIGTYLGFTDEIKEPRKTRIENTLNHLYKYNGEVMNAVTFLCKKLLEGCYLSKRDNYSYIKRNGEYSKPKTLYMYMSADRKTYFELNKTQYDFVQYLIYNEIDTEEKMVARDKFELDKIEADKREEEEAKRLEKEREIREVEERNKFKEWLLIESAGIPDSQEEIIDSIFRSIYGQENHFNYTLAVCINNYDNPMCKEEIKSRLHNENKASIKIFECLTGLKLPSGYRDRMKYLDGITTADFKAPVYKAYKKVKEYEKKKEVFYILLRDYTWHEVFAEPIEKYGIKMFLFCDCGVWKLSHVDTGLSIVSGKTKTECLQKLNESVEKNGIEKIRELLSLRKKQVFERAGESPRMKEYEKKNV